MGRAVRHTHQAAHPGPAATARSAAFLLCLAVVKWWAKAVQSLKYWSKGGQKWSKGGQKSQMLVKRRLKSGQKAVKRRSKVSNIGQKAVKSGQILVKRWSKVVKYWSKGGQKWSKVVKYCQKAVKSCPTACPDPSCESDREPAQAPAPASDPQPIRVRSESVPGEDGRNWRAVEGARICRAGWARASRLPSRRPSGARARVAPSAARCRRRRRLPRASPSRGGGPPRAGVSAPGRSILVKRAVE